MSSSTDVPSEFLCPITYELMTDPVTGSDGHTYERTAIEQWLQTHNTSPLSNARLTMADLKPNYALRSAIERFLAANPTPSAPKQGPVDCRFRARTDGQHLFVECEKEQECLEVVTILVDDVSGSMGSPSSNTGGSSAAEGAMFSRLDLVKHANRTVAAMHAAQGASLGIITFSDTAATVLPVKKMDATGLAEADRAITGMRLEGSTNMWAGLQEALKQAAFVAKAKPNAFINIIFLTDGEPTADYIPRVGLQEALRRRLADITAKVTISCFGFGYALDAKLLQDLCTIGGGIYGYLPDCSMVGSVSINAAAAALSTVATDVKVGLGSIHLGNIQAGATRFVKMPATVGAKLEVSYANGGKASVTVEQATQDESDNAKIIFKLKDMLLEASHSREFFPEQQAKVETMLSWIGDDACENPFATAIKQDIKHADDHKGQLLKALKNSEWYQSWGLNHLISYIRALDQQQCVNFKDAGLQFFATDLFRRIQDKGNDLFDSLPVPQPSCASYGSGYRGVGTLNLPTNMAAFNTAQGGCWLGHCKVQMADGSWEMTHQLRAGDVVLGGHRILCVVRTKHKRPIKIMCNEQLAITPWHPIRLPFASSPEWVFPCRQMELLDLEAEEGFTHYVYNLVLESGHYVRIGNYDVCTLGHYFQDNDVIKHNYFGTGRVIDDLMRKEGWSQGMVTLIPEEQVRGADGQVVAV